MCASRDILCRSETLKLPRLSPIGTGARQLSPAAVDVEQGSCPAWYFGGGALRLALKPMGDWQEGPPVVPLVCLRTQWKTWFTQTAVKSPGRRGDVTSRKGGNNPATWLKGGREPSLFICTYRPGLRLGGQAA